MSVHNQHYIPAVYLRRFQINETDKKNMVYSINLNHKTPSIRKKSVRSNDFTLHEFYNDERLIKPDGLEDAFNKGFECKYNDTIEAITTEGLLDNEPRKNLIGWLWLSQFRTPFKRDKIRRELDFKYFWLKVSEPKKYPYDVDDGLQDYLDIASQTIHLDEIIEKNQFKQSLQKFISLLLCKEWVILKAVKDFQFFTNDQPGFVIDFESSEEGKFPFETLSSLEWYSTLYFVLSPKFCIKMSPFPVDTPVERNAWNTKIKFKEVDVNEWTLIQRGMCYTAYRFVISNSKELLETFLKLR